MVALRKAIAATTFGVAASHGSESLMLIQVKANQSQSLASNWWPFGSKSASLPPLVEDFPETALTKCSKDLVSEWEGRGDATKSFMDSWRKSDKKGAIVSDAGGSSCLMEGPSKTKKVMTLVNEPEAEACKYTHGRRKPEKAVFEAKDGQKRKYDVMWPAEGTCSKKTPCSVMMFFHGCAAMVLPAMQAGADDQCYNDLHTVMIMPKLEKGEKWTEQGSSMLENFVMPLWEAFKEEHGEKLDTSKVASVGSSMGSGMALQAALLHPDQFSLAVAAGLADGAHCEDESNGGKVAWDSKAILAQKQVPHSGWKLKGVVAIMSENEPQLDERVSELVSVLEENDVLNKASLNVRLYGGVGHAKGIVYAFNQWAGLQKTIFQGKF